jgi:hypothetical protein
MKQANAIGWDSRQAHTETQIRTKHIVRRDVNFPSDKAMRDKATASIIKLQSSQVNAYTKQRADALRNKVVQAYYKTPATKRPVNVTDIIDANYMGMRV